MALIIAKLLLCLSFLTSAVHSNDVHAAGSVHVAPLDSPVANPK